MSRGGRYVRAALAGMICLTAALLPASGRCGQAAAGDVAWRVIVHPLNPVRSIARDELERIYRGKSRFWRDGSAILPLNLSGSDPLRRAFSAQAMRDSEENLATYWNREYFQGVAPPAVLQSSKAVRAYVAVTPNAIGYIDANDVDPSVAVVEVVDVR